MSQQRATRRRFLALTGAAGIVGTAGCTERLKSATGQLDGESNETGGGDDSSTPGLTDGVPPLETEFNSRERFRQPGDSLDDFADLEPWTVTQGSGQADTDVVFDGEQSFRLRSNESQNIIAERSLAGEDLRETDLSFAVRTSTPDSITVNLRIVDQFGSDKIYSLRQIRYRKPDVGWFRASPGVFQQSEYEPALDHLDRLEIQVLHSMPEAEVWIDDLRTHETADQGYVMLSWDDGMLDFYETAAPMHDEYGFSAVQAPVPRWVEQGEDDVMSVSALQERQEAGDQIVVHGTHDPIHELDDESTIQARLERDKRWFIENEFEGANYLVHPHNSFDKTSLELATNYHYCAGFNQAGNVNTTSVYGFDPMVLPRTIGHDLEIAKRSVNLAAQFNQCTILNFHTFDGNSTMPKADYEALLEHVDSADVEVITFDELWSLRASDH